MRVVDEIKRRSKLIVGPIFGISLVCYFTYHLIQGDRGLMAYMSLTQQIAEAKATLATVDNQRLVLDRRVASLRPEHIDPDMLDERARSTLNVIGPNEVVIFPQKRSR